MSNQVGPNLSLNNIVILTMYKKKQMIKEIKRPMKIRNSLFPLDLK
jgi:hypothetical protein